MLIVNKIQFIEANFDSEQELEDVVIENYELIFGSNSIFLPKKKIKTSDGSGTIPDGFAIDLESRSWYLMEAELAKHSVWSHIAPQVSKQVIAAAQLESKQQIIELAIKQFETDDNTKEKFRDLEIRDIHIRKELAEILEQEPIIAIPIDRITEDLKQWAETLKFQVKLWLINKFVEFGNETNIGYQFPDENRPDIDTSTSSSNGKKKIATYNVKLSDLIEEDILNVGDELIMSYKARDGKRKKYTAIILENGSLEVLGKTFTSLSYAAMCGIKDAGSTRRTVNGWSSWKFKGKKLKQIRREYLEMKNS
ncbi:hypothetical protein D7030_13455 [Flavobacteriaceae bacterium AU392]|nr:hypothetical protein D1817_05035 [Flavobacteriaceae bacterium]RKM81308.1 hypothetical protein D7030_13455 [Flavobacteriaceae bacterium AU392]